MESKRPSETLNQIARYGGMRYISDKKVSTFWFAYMIVFLLGNVAIGVGTCTHTFSDDTIGRRVTSFQITLSMVSIAGRQLYMALSLRYLEKIQSELDEIWDEIQKDVIVAKVEKPGEEIKQFLIIGSFLYFFPFPGSIIDWWRENYGMPEEQKALFPVDSAFPKTWKYTSFCYELILLIIGMLTELLTVFLFVAISRYIGYFMRCLQVMLRTEKSRENYGNKIFKFHIRIMRLVKHFNKLFSAELVCVYFVNVTELSCRVYRLLTGKKGDAEFITNLIFCFVIMYIPFVINLCGHLFEKEAAYQNQWYEVGVKRRKDLLMLMAVAERPMAFHYKHSITFGMPQFAAFCRAAYSFIAGMQQFV